MLDTERACCERIAVTPHTARRLQHWGRAPGSIRIHNMWIVRLALRRPYSFTVMAILIVLVGVVTITRMSTDIFPNINIPVVSVIWSYAGVSPEEMEMRFVTVCERAMTTTVIDIDQQKLYGKGLSPADVSNAVTAQNVILPAGTQKIGDREYNVRLNSSPELLQVLNDLPIKQVNGATVYIRDVANVRDGFAVQTNIVAQNRIRSALLTVLKSASASTLDIIKRVKDALPRIQATLPKELQISQLFDQSIFVRASINGVLREGVIAACLTALMILLFLGNWRSTLVVATSIPLSILCSIIVLGALGETLNIMTLGGLALAVGILVDDATVELENIHRNLAMGKPMIRAILDGAAQIAVPAFVSTLSICIVFVPIFFLSGTAKYLFQPLATAVIFAMLASYLLSRTVVPTMVKFLMRGHMEEIDTSLARTLDENGRARSPSAPGSLEGDSSAQKPGVSLFARIREFFSGIHEHFNHGFEKLRARYVNALRWCL